MCEAARGITRRKVLQEVLKEAAGTESGAAAIQGRQRDKVQGVQGPWSGLVVGALDSDSNWGWEWVAGGGGCERETEFL